MGFVVEFELTAERRNQLAVLLGDEQRLRAEYPKVAEYLDMASRLPGTGDSQADAAFDLRFIHYMTGGRSVAANPYWAIIAPSVFEYEGRCVVNGGERHGSGRLAFAQPRSTDRLLECCFAVFLCVPGCCGGCGRV